MKTKSALTFIELLIVVGIISFLSFPLYLSFTKTQANQGLRASSEILADDIKRAHVFARESRDRKSWGIIKVEESGYSLVSGNSQNYTTIKTRLLEPYVKFDNDFSVWFELGTGTTDKNHTISISNTNNQQIDVEVLKSGTVDFKSI